ncbi:MAG: hypothetical protein ICV80_00790 [Microcoleus sp. T1-bin1]|nr:hypothetical protein [Microcoleus sp. T1-bin1]
MSTCRNRLDTPKMKVVSIADRAKPSEKQKARSRQALAPAAVFWAINHIGQFFLSVVAGDDSLRIWQICDRDGNTWWHGCDRATGRSTCVETEDEMRAWLDRRYCQ